MRAAGNDQLQNKDEIMLTRREFLELSASAAMGATIMPASMLRSAPASSGIWVNDIHSQLNRTRVHKIIKPGSLEALQEVLRNAHSEGRAVSIAAGRHAMGGQQFGTDTILIDASGLNTVLDFDPERGEIEVGAGIQWPKMIDYLLREQQGAERNWGIRQKQTGADRLSIGGALAANAHGRGLRYKPIVGDVASFTLVDATGEARECSRTKNAELFQLAIGGYGLFGIIASVRISLAPRRKIERVVEVIDAGELAARFEERIEKGFLYGDFQYSTDLNSDTGLRKGVFSCYHPVPDSTPIPEKQAKLLEKDWVELLHLAHVDRGQAFARYSEYYLSTSGQIYWSDTHQMSTYIDDYHQKLDGRLGPLQNGTEMISEIYVPRHTLRDFLEDVRGDFLENDVNLIYGTIRLIEKDDETFLAWARERFASVIFNLHVGHDAVGLKKGRADFRRLIDRGIQYGGSYFLTYHRWATREQVLKCYPQFPEFLRLKKKHDPEIRFQSEWYRYYENMFADEIAR